MVAKVDVKKVVTSIIKDFEGTHLVYGKKSSIPPLTAMSTGFPGLDHVLGIGGMPSGRMVEVYGPEGGGKTTLSLQFLVAGQRAGESVAFIDVEHHVDTKYAEALGLKLDDSAVIVQPPDGEDGFEIVRRLLEAGVKRIVIDSMAALLTKVEIEAMKKRGPAAIPQPGVQARMLSQASKMLTPVLARAGAILFYTNQLRDNLSPFGSSETTTGGRAPKFYESVRMRLSRDSSIRSAEWGFWTKCVIRKNHYAKPNQEWKARLVFGHGFDIDYDVVRQAVEVGVIAKSGNRYIHQGQLLGCGMEVAAGKLAKDPETRELILKDLKDGRTTKVEE